MHYFPTNPQKKDLVGKKRMTKAVTEPAFSKRQNSAIYKRIKLLLRCFGFIENNCFKLYSERLLKKADVRIDRERDGRI